MKIYWFILSCHNVRSSSPVSNLDRVSVHYLAILWYIFKTVCFCWCRFFLFLDLEYGMATYILYCSESILIFYFLDGNLQYLAEHFIH